MRELPRKLTPEQLAELFEGHTRLVELLAETDDPLERAEATLVALSHEEKIEALNAHPAIGRPDGVSARSVAEQGVAGRTKREVLDVLRTRIGRTRDEELETGCRELVAIARDRWIRT
jgi:2-oxo-4-hydroxy-4-carboxy--5-ureidoimidazoline (OHCU) decarboxylase